MKKRLLFMAALLPAAVLAAETQDTTFVVNGKKIVVDAAGEKTNVKVYGNDGTQETKVSEMNFVDGQEVEKVYVGSPFIPSGSLQHLDYSPRFPTVWFGMSYMPAKVFGSRQTAGGRRSKSFELGITPYYLSVPLTKSQNVSFNVAAQLVWSHLCFQKDLAVSESGGKFSFSTLEGKASGNNMNFISLRVPLMVSMQNNDFSMGIGLSPEVRTNAWYRLSQPTGNVRETYKTNRFGLGVTMNYGFGPVTVSSTIGLTPLYKTADGKKAYQSSASIGIDALALMKILNYSKDRKKSSRDGRVLGSY